MTLRDINLVPDDVLAKYHARRHILRWGLVLIGCLTIISVTYWYQAYVVLARLRPSTTLADIHDQLGATLDEISAAQKEIERLSTQQAILKELSVHQSFPGLLELMADTLSPQTWLTAMEIDADGPRDARAGMRLKGYALSNELLADFLTRLSAARSMDSVVLKLAREVHVPGLITDSDQLVKVVDFDIVCRLEDL
jgi:Tfp pilus assembly protein PilN